ncbi:MAG: acyl-CoA dehydrogenase family protein [Bacteroidales bacterium]|nr:acyl-CoA dehydrogenase family protein [Bacteroidales bacterium]MBN2758635.1 acyl-CoA dehydrogenase family protein [Bacteroidales bacterium]
MESIYFNEEHNLFRNSIRDFVNREIKPFAEEWEKNRQIPKDIWLKMGEQGYLGINLPEKYGGMDLDFFFSVIFIEETSKAGLGGFAAAVGVHEFMSVAHIAETGSDFLKEKYLTEAIKGTKLGALAVTEPIAGSDVGNIRTSAKKEGDFYIINGSKTFITNGYYSDFATVAVKTDKDAGFGGISLIVIDMNSEGITRSKLNKIGWHSSDTAEIFFDDVKVPVENLIGEENKGFYYIMESFQLERLIAAIGSTAGAEEVLNITLQYMNERKAFGKSINKFQILRHRMSNMITDVEICKQFVYHTSWMHNNKKFAVKESTMAKLKATELLKTVTDECLQMFGGYGYMDEYPISRFYRDARVGTIVGGTTDIMNEIIAKIVIDDKRYDSTYKGDKEYSETKAQNYEEKKSEIQANTAKEIILSLEKRFRPEKAEGINTIIHFFVSGDNGGDFTVRIENNICKVIEKIEGEAKCTVKVKDSIYEELELGKRGAEMAVAFGKIKISNIGEMKKFTKLFQRLF